MHNLQTEKRNIEACYVHPGLVRGSVVQGSARENGAMELVRFVARNIRPIEPLQWKLPLVGLIERLEQPTGECWKRANASRSSDVSESGGERTSRGSTRK